MDSPTISAVLDPPDSDKIDTIYQAIAFLKAKFGDLDAKLTTSSEVVHSTAAQVTETLQTVQSLWHVTAGDEKSPPKRESS